MKSRLFRFALSIALCMSLYAVSHALQGLPGPQASPGVTVSTGLSDSSNLARLNTMPTFKSDGVFTLKDSSNFDRLTFDTTSQQFRVDPAGSSGVVYSRYLGSYNGTSLISLDGTTVGVGPSLTINGSVINYANINTAGWGVPAIYGSGRSAAQTALVASVATYTVGAADGSFIVSANVNITAFAVGTFNVNCTYTDETNTAQTLKLNFSSVTGTVGIALAAAGPFEGIPARIRAKAATAITITTSGTFTSLTYNVEGDIIQVK